MIADGGRASVSSFFLKKKNSTSSRVKWNRILGRTAIQLRRIELKVFNRIRPTSLDRTESLRDLPDSKDFNNQKKISQRSPLSHCRHTLDLILP